VKRRTTSPGIAAAGPLALPHDHEPYPLELEQLENASSVEFTPPAEPEAARASATGAVL